MVISARNFVRSLGGAIGLAVSSAIFSNSFQSHISAQLSPAVYEAVHRSTFSVPNLDGLDTATKEKVLDAYGAASRSVAMMWVSVVGVCLLLMVFVKDKGLQRKEEQHDASTEEHTNEPEKAIQVEIGAGISLHERS